MDEEKSRLLVSEKQVLWTRQVAKLKEGQVVEGKVASITDFGVFVELQLAGGAFPDNDAEYACVCMCMCVYVQMCIY